nr:hypothetical protein [Wenxinia marina]
MSRRAFALGLPALLGGCGGAQSVWAPDDAIQRAAYRHDGPPMVTLFTMKNAESDNGAHTGLMINASQRVIFDPAGTFGHPTIPERNDLHYGITPALEEFYVTYHARVSYYVVRQDAPVTLAQAEAAFAQARVEGPVPKAACTMATARVLRAMPGWEDISVTLFPDNLARQFARKPGVTEREVREDDSADKDEAQAAFEAALQAGE